MRNKKIFYFEDSSNNDNKFERVKTRFYLNHIKKNIWHNVTYDLNHFSNLNSNLLKKTDYFFNRWSNKNIIIHEGGAVRVDHASFRNIFEKSFLLALRIVGKSSKLLEEMNMLQKEKKHLNLYQVFLQKN